MQAQGQFCFVLRSGGPALGACGALKEGRRGCIQPIPVFRREDSDARSRGVCILALRGTLENWGLKKRVP